MIGDDMRRLGRIANEKVQKAAAVEYFGSFALWIFKADQ